MQLLCTLFRWAAERAAMSGSTADAALKALLPPMSLSVADTYAGLGDAERGWLLSLSMWLAAVVGDSVAWLCIYVGTGVGVGVALELALLVSV